MGYMNVPQGRNPWTSEPPMPHISQRQPFPRYHTSQGNMYRPWGGDAETSIGRRLGQIAYGQSMYVSEWIRPQIDANEAKAAAKAAGEEDSGDNGGGGTKPQPPSVKDRLEQTATATQQQPKQQPSPSGDGFVASPNPAPWNGGKSSVEAYRPGVGGRPAPWKDVSYPSGRGFGDRLQTQSRVQARNVQTGAPSLLGARPAQAEPVGPPQPRRRIAGMDPRKRGTFFNFE